MSTPAQLQANRRNAERSTGPRSEAGKQASSANALKHGAYATKPVAIPRGQFAEDEAELTAYVDQLVASLAPRDPVETEAAYRIAIVYLRFRRLYRLEAEAIAGDAPTRTESRDDLDIDPFVSPDDRVDAKREFAAFRALQESVSLATVIDARIDRELENALNLYERLQRRALPTDTSDEE